MTLKIEFYGGISKSNMNFCLQLAYQKCYFVEV